MEKNIEIEVRGPLSKEAYDTLKAFLEANGQKVAEKHRIFIDYSTFLPGGVRERSKDIRLRVTNGIPEVIVKLGAWGSAESRKELSVTTAPGTFDTLVEIFQAMGYEKGMMCIRNSVAYEYKGIEFAVVEVPDHSYYFEAEKMAHADEDSKKILEEITAVCTGELHLTLFTDQELFAYIETLNKEANEVFDAATVQPGYFKARFGL